MVGAKKEKIDDCIGGRSSRRTLCTTESTWCKAVSGGTGIVVLTVQLSKPTDNLVSVLQNGIRHLQQLHPILGSKLHYNPTKKLFSFITPPPPPLAAADQTSSMKIKVVDISSTSELISRYYNNISKENHEQHDQYYNYHSPINVIQEHEMNKNEWIHNGSNVSPSSSEEGIEVCFCTVYELSGPKSIVALRLHAAACDRTTAESLLKELLEFAENDSKNHGEEYYSCCSNRLLLHAGVEDLIPNGMRKKTVWAHGLDVLEYSLNSFRLTNLKFRDVNCPRCSQIVRLRINSQYTDQLLSGCKSRGMKLFGLIAAAGILAAADSYPNGGSNQKYAVATLIDCRKLLDPPMASGDYGFYHSAIVNTHTVSSMKSPSSSSDQHLENKNNLVWNLATRCYTAVENSKKRNKHFSDMADLNFLMVKAMENPNLTASSSLRTSLISVFEDPVMFDSSDQIRQELGLEDYIGCSSAHGIGPSVAFFDTIRDGELDCVCVYPSPLHSRYQMIELIDNMKRVLIHAVVN